MASSCTVPKIMVASSAAKLRMVSMASLVSLSFNEPLAVMFTKIPRAPDRSTPSSKGLRTACSAAMRARSGPLAVAVPIMALPCSPITVFTSSKSTFTSPSTLIISAMPATALLRTSSAAAKASSWVMSSPRTSSSFSLRMTIRQSTLPCSSSRPCSAARMRLPPSNEKGLVTTATVSAPLSLATSATTGAAPVPVPPPMPAVMKTICAPSRASAIRALSDSAAARPASGFAPAPRPELPSCKARVPFDLARLWASVLAQMNSTPCTPRRIIWATALPPAPPTPTTLITVPAVSVSSISNDIPLSLAS